VGWVSDLHVELLSVQLHVSSWRKPCLLLAREQGCGLAHVVHELIAYPARRRGDRVGGQSSVVEQVPDIHVAEEDERVSEEASMTAPPDAFGAHHQHSVAHSQFDQRIEAGSERFCGHVIGIRPEGLVAQPEMGRLRLRGPSAAQSSIP